MSAVLARLGFLLAGLLLVPVRQAQEPPAPVPAEEGAGGVETPPKEEAPAPQEGEKPSETAPPGPGQEPAPKPEPKPEPKTDDPVQGPPPPPEASPPVSEEPRSEVVPAPEVDPGPPAVEVPPAAPPPRPAHPAVTWPLAIEAIELHLRGIAELHPDVATLEVLGRSAGGRELLALRLSAKSAAPQETPVLLLVDHQGPTSAGPEAMLELAWTLAEGFETDERVRASLTRAALLIAPALDPDARASAQGTRSEVLFERNFPSGWQPESVRPGSGRVSLSKPETLAVARTLTELKGCAVLLGFAAPAPRGAPYPGAELPDADREVFAKLGAALELEGAAPLVPWFELGSPGGSLFDFAYQARGIYPLVFTLPAGDELATGGLVPFSAQVTTRVLRCLSLLPRVEIAQEGLERLASDTWQLDVRIQNSGVVPTSSALSRHHEALTDVALRLDGAKLVATAKKPESGATFMDASFQVHSPLSGGILAGGEGRWLRLILEAGSGAEVRVTAASAWAGSASVQVTLP